ncbi:MAG: hypothetical protein JWO24_4142, partial [Rhodospirillales bacterium]|nr:hypothetical protein [Rhodospirillales bacterium]
SRLRAALPHRCRVRPDGHDPHHAAKAGAKVLNVNPNFADRLLGQLVRYPLCLKAGGLTLVDLIKHASHNQPLVETIRLNGAAYSALRCHPPFDHN